MFRKIQKFIQKNSLPLFLALILILLIALFHEVMTPFVIALVVVYLMEPLVGRLSKKKIKNKAIPRWAAVISVYIVFLSSVVGFGFIVIPPLASEIGQATEELPAFFTRLKDEDLPRWSANFDNSFFVHTQEDIKESVEQTSLQLHQAWNDAIQIHQESLPPLYIKDNDFKPLSIIGIRTSKATQPFPYLKDGERVLFKLRKDVSTEDLLVIAGNEDIKIETDEKGNKTVKLKPIDKKKERQQAFNLEQRINRAIAELLEGATHYIGNALSVLQYLLEFLINAFIQSILVFMLAAFISIDLPKFMKWFRTMFENERGDSSGFDELVRRFDRGLSGVIRGQLLICCINGTLTGLGLWVLGVDFSLLLGIIAGALSIIPIFGTIISTIPAVLLGLVQSPTTAFFVLAWILLIHFVDANFMTPKIVGSSSHLHPVVIVFALLAGQTSFGVLGMILAMPVTSLCWTVFQFTRDKLRERSAQLRELELAQLAEATIPPTNFESWTTPAPQTYASMGTITNAEESQKIRAALQNTQQNAAISSPAHNHTPVPDSIEILPSPPSKSNKEEECDDGMIEF